MFLPPNWRKVGKPLTSGGQATATPVEHLDGREGVHRQLKSPVSDLDRNRLRRELEILSRDVDHRGVVTLYDWDADIDPPWYISERGDSFERWWSDVRGDFQNEPAVLVHKALGVLTELASALAACHAKGIVHRDIKPKNLVAKRGASEPWPILIDFGIAHVDAADRLTPASQAVGNARFSPDVMRNRLDEVRPWLDVFDLAQLFIWMLAEKAPKDHWQRPVPWKYAVYSDGLPEDLLLSIKAVTAACSTEETSPANAAAFTELLGNLFRRHQESEIQSSVSGRIAAAKRRGMARKLLSLASGQEEIEASAPLAEKVYLDLRHTLSDALQEIAASESSAKVLFDKPFSYRTVGATDLYSVCVGPEAHRIQLRVKGKLVTRSATPPSNEGNRAFWQRHLPDDAICFTFALEGGVVQAHDIRYLEGRWITIRRDGSIYLHPLGADFGSYANNDLGGSAEGAGVPASMRDVRDFATSVLTSEKSWEYIAESGS